KHLAVESFERGLVVECVHRTRATGHEQLDDAVYFRGGMVDRGGVCFAREDLREGDRCETAADIRKAAAAGQIRLARQHGLVFCSLRRTKYAEISKPITQKELKNKPKVRYTRAGLKSLFIQSLSGRKRERITTIISATPNISANDSDQVASVRPGGYM